MRLFRLFLAIVALCALSAPAFAGALAYQQATSMSASSAINLPNIPTGTVGSTLISVEAQAIRWRDDNTDPTSAVGQPVAVGQAICYGYPPNNLRLISQVAGATVNVTYYTGLGCATR